MFDPTPPPNADADASDPAEEESSGHPLFPRAYTETGPDRRRFDWIQIVRYLPDGTREVCPKMYKGSELRSWQQVVDEHGGECTYQAGAQTSDHRFTAWSERCYFASPPRKAFSGGPWVPKQELSNAAPAVSPQTTQDAMLITLVKLLAERRDPPPPPPPNPIEMLREAAALLNGANRAPNPFEVVKEILPLMNSGEQTSRTLKQGIELARELFQKNNAAAAPTPSRSSSDDMDGIMSIVKMITAVRPANPPAAATPAAAPAVNPPQQQYAFAPPCPPPPGYGWMYTQQGWVAFPMAMPAYSPVVNRPAPIPQPSTSPGRAGDYDDWIRAALANPETRAKLEAFLSSGISVPAPVPRPPPAPPAPVPAPPAASPAPGTPSPLQAPPGAPQAPASPAHALSDMLTASGWSFTPATEAPAWHYTKPADSPAPAPAPLAAVPPAEQPPDDAFEIPADVPMDDELREMLAEPEFQELAASLVPPEAQGAFAKLVQKNALHLQQTAEA